MAYLTGRRLVPELMDEPDADPRELARALLFLQQVNRRLGGAAAAIAPMQQWRHAWPTDRPLRVLDVGTGSADIPLAIADWAGQRELPIEIIAVDMHETTLRFAREHVGDRPEITLLAADARQLTDRFEPDAFDVAHAGLFLHHLPDIEVVTVLRAMQRLARIGLIWNDLLRSRRAKLGVRLATIGAPRMVKHDALVSVDAGFTRAEALDLAGRVGLANVRWRTSWCYRFALTSTRDPLD